MDVQKADEREIRARNETFSEAEIDELRLCFSKMTCSLRVLGSQFGLEPYELDEVDENCKTLADRKQRLLEELIRKEKLTSWEQLASTLERPALKLWRLAIEIKRKHMYYSKQRSVDSTASHLSMDSPTSPPQSLASSFSSTMEVSQGEFTTTIYTLFLVSPFHPLPSLNTPTLSVCIYQLD